MGFHVGWLTVRGKTPDQVRTELGLLETDAREEIPESDLTSVLLPSGWYLVFCNDPTAIELEDRSLQTLSRGADVMAFLVEEASMVSIARGYAAGRRIWEVAHDSSKAPGDLETGGTLPSDFAAVRDRLMKESLFDVPAELSKSMTGFRHDEGIDGIEGDAFTVLERAPRPRRLMEWLGFRR